MNGFNGSWTMRQVRLNTYPLQSKTATPKQKALISVILVRRVAQDIEEIDRPAKQLALKKTTQEDRARANFVIERISLNDFSMHQGTS